MAKTRSMTRNNVGGVPWSDLNRDLLLLVMMRLGVIDFIAFSGVCKSWRSFALCNRKIFMASRPPMLISFSDPYKEERCCFLEDFEGRKFKTLLPISGGRRCVEVTCGYLVLFGRETKDFWLVNPITRHQLHFPDFPLLADVLIKAILVFSPSIYDWALVVVQKYSRRIWFSIVGKGAWNLVLSDSPFYDLLAFKGKIYTIHKGLCLSELRIDSTPKLTILKTTNFQKPQLLYPYPMFASSSENLYVIDRIPEKPFNIFVLDLGEMKWVSLKEKSIREYAFFFSILNHDVAIKPESWVAETLLQFKRYAWLHKTDVKCLQDIFFYAFGWYFPHLCLDVHILDELST